MNFFGSTCRNNEDWIGKKQVGEGEFLVLEKRGQCFAQVILILDCYRNIGFSRSHVGGILDWRM